MTLHQNVHDKLLAELNGNDGIADPVNLNNQLRLLCKWRYILIQNTLLQHQGVVVMQGPLKGLDFLSRSAEGCHIAKLLGCYEQPLQPYIEAAISCRYETIINIGCAEGYYAVGMARRLPTTKIKAFDTNEKAQNACRSLAEKNRVAERITVGGQFDPGDFAHYGHEHVLVMCDIEGAEKDLLDPQIAPALRGMDIIVESHETLVPGITSHLKDRFSPSHEITLVEDDGQRQLESSQGWFKNLAHLDQLLATWEWRSGPTPWLVMKAKK